MAIDKKRMQEDASNIINLLKKLSPGRNAKEVAKILQDNQFQIKSFLKKFLKSNPTTAGATQAVEFLVDRYKLPESIATRIVRNEMTDANIPVDPSETADEGFPSRPAFESSAEDTSVPPTRKFPDLPITREMLEKLLKDRRRIKDPGFPDYDGERRFPGGPPFNPRPFKREPFDMTPKEFKREPFVPDTDTGLMELFRRFKNPDIRPMRELAMGGRAGFSTGGFGSFKDFIESTGDEELMDLYSDFLETGDFSRLEKRLKEKGYQPGEYAQGGRVNYADGTEDMKMASMDANEKEFMRLVDDFMERGFSLQQAIEAAKEELEKKSLAKGGRVLKQTGGISESRLLPPEFIEAAQKTFLADLTRQAGLPTVTTANVQQPGETAEQFAARQAQAQQFGITRAGMAEVAPKVADETALQQQARDLATGLGSFEPFLTKATTAADAATALTGTGAGTGAGSIESYKSPFQQQVIDTTLAEFDRQAQIRRNQQAAQTLNVAGAFGGGREGVQRAEFDAASDRNRAALQAQLLQTGFESAASRRQQDLANQINLSNQQRGLGAAAQDFARAQISGLGTLGAAQQAQQQAVLDAQRQAAQLAVDDPRRRLSLLGTGITSITPGAGTVTLQEAPMAAAPSPLTQALGFGLMGADIYGRIFRPTGR
jgi:hypothetical protein